MLIEQRTHLVDGNVALGNAISGLERFMDIERRASVHTLTEQLGLSFELKMHTPALSQLGAGGWREVLLGMVEVARMEGSPVADQVRILTVLRGECFTEIRVAQSSIIVQIISAEEERHLVIRGVQA